MTNKRVWDQFKHTDPKFTKPFSKFGRTLTTTDPMYQVMRMTDYFGPVGEGWTYEVKYVYTEKNVFAELKLGWRDDTSKEFNRYGPVSAVNPLYNSKGTLDDEAPKKAMTDAMTKAMSHLGMSADVFLGLFDSNKYVSEMKEKFAAKSNVDKSKVREVTND